MPAHLVYEASVASKILIVDDDAVVQRVLKARLHERGCETVFAADGISAIGVARKEQPDLIVLDIGLPAGDAFVVLERLKTMPALANIPVIVITATATEENRRRSLAGGAVGFFEKGADTDELVAAIVTTLAA
jgi:CheY-like chemotaxis protein